MPRFVIALFCLACPLAAQQDRASILGTVSDPSGAVVPGAAVLVTNVGTNAAFRTVSNAQGFYTAPSLQAGAYTVAVEALGFKKMVRRGIVLQVEQRAQVD